MKPAPTLHGADRSCSVWHCSSAFLIVAVSALLNACGGGGAGESGGAAAPPVLPATCVTGGPASAILTWDAVTGATGYRIYYDTEAGMNPQFEEVTGGTTTTLTITAGLISGTTYYFAATALDSSTTSESGFSNVVCKTMP